MSFVWVACIIAGAALGIWATGIFLPHQRQKRARDAVQAVIIIAAFLFMILGSLYWIR